MKTDKTFGIYIHIPFCVKKCRYCDFTSAAADEETMKAYTDTLCAHIKEAAELMDRSESRYIADSIFFGGGTPSLLKTGEIAGILEQLRKYAVLSENCEISVECNPGTVTKEKLISFKQAGVNRLSFGLQSADNAMLKLLGRIHTWEEFQKNYILARECGFDNINIDVMSALPGQSLRNHLGTLNSVLKLAPEHISSYSLIIEENTPFYNMYRDGKGLISEDETVRMDEETWKLLEDSGYGHYEISNYARPGYECRHNIRYWSCDEYLGFGTAAASYMSGNCGITDNYAGKVRFTNIRDTKRFTGSSIREAADETEWLSIEDEMEEMAFMGLRMKRGIDTKEFRKRFNKSFDDVYGGIVERYQELGMLEEKAGYVFLTKKGIEISNTIMSDFILTGKDEI